MTWWVGDMYPPSFGAMLQLPSPSNKIKRLPALTDPSPSPPRPSPSLSGPLPLLPLPLVSPLLPLPTSMSPWIWTALAVLEGLSPLRSAGAVFRPGSAHIAGRRSTLWPPAPTIATCRPELLTCQLDSRSPPWLPVPRPSSPLPPGSLSRALDTCPLSLYLPYPTPSLAKKRSSQSVGV